MRAGPLFNPIELPAATSAAVARLIRATLCVPQFPRLFGAAAFATDAVLDGEAPFATGRDEIADPSIHPFTRKFDTWLQGKPTLTLRELARDQAFNDPKRGDCAACHPDRPMAGRLPPLLADAHDAALGVPRNPVIPANVDPPAPYRADVDWADPPLDHQLGSRRRSASRAWRTPSPSCRH